MSTNLFSNHHNMNQFSLPEMPSSPSVRDVSQMQSSPAAPMAVQHRDPFGDISNMTEGSHSRSSSVAPGSDWSGSLFGMSGMSGMSGMGMGMGMGYSMSNANEQMAYRLRELEQENGSLRQQVAALSGKCQTMEEVYMFTVKTIPAVLTATNPFKVSFPVPSRSDTTSIPSLPTPPDTKPKERDDYPKIKFWYRSSYSESNGQSDGVSTSTTTRGGSGAAKNINVCTKYIEDESGIPVDGQTAGLIRKCAYGIFQDLAKEGHAPSTWGQAGNLARAYYYFEIEKQYPILSYCANHWKAEFLATKNYSHWARRRTEQLSGNMVVVKEETGAVTKGKKRGRSISDVGQPDPDPIDGALHNSPTEKAKSSEIPKPPEAVSGSCVTNPLIERRRQRQKPSPPTTTLTPSSDSKLTAASSAPLNDGLALDKDVPVTEAAPPANGSSSDDISKLSQRAESPHGEIEQGACPAQEDQLPDPNVTMTPAADSEIRAGLSPQPSPPPANANLTANSNGTGGSGDAKNRKKKPTKSKTARNLCAIQWCAENANGTTVQFDQYWANEVKGTELENQFISQSNAAKGAKSTAAAAV